MLMAAKPPATARKGTLPCSSFLPFFYVSGVNGSPGNWSSREQRLGWDQAKEGVSVGGPPAPPTTLVTIPTWGWRACKPKFLGFRCQLCPASLPHTGHWRPCCSFVLCRDLQHQHHGNLLEMQSLGPYPDPLNLNLHFNETSGLSMHTLQCGELSE